MLNADLPAVELGTALSDRPIEEAIVVDLIPQDADVREELVTVSDDTDLSENCGMEGFILEAGREEEKAPGERLSSGRTCAEAVSLLTSDEATLLSFSGTVDADVSPLSVDNGSSAAQQLVETLHAANGPPKGETVPSDAALESIGASATFLSAESTQFIVPQGDTLSGQPVIEQDVYVYGRLSPGNSPGIVTITGNLTFSGTDTGVIDDSYVPPPADDTVGTLVIEIGGDTPGAGYDQVRVSGTATLGGTLEVVLINSFEPSLGDTFDFLTFGTLSGQFAEVHGPMGWGDGNLYFEVVEQADCLQLVVSEIPTGMDLHTTTSASNRMIQATSDLADQAAQRLRDLLLGTPELTGEAVPATGVTLDDLFDLSDYLNVGSSLDEYLVPIQALGGRDDFSIEGLVDYLRTNWLDDLLGAQPTTCP